MAAGQSFLPDALHATAHCTTGCVIGEVAGLAIGVTIGLGAWLSMGLATLLACVAGLSLASIAAMEVAMNAADYSLGGAQVASIAEPRFWWALALAVPPGFAAALPVNWLMIRRGSGHRHH